MELEHYFRGDGNRTRKRALSSGPRAVARFGDIAAKVIHRVGPLMPMDQIVLVAVTSAHRGMSFRPAEFIMDYLGPKHRLKKEQTADGARWVDRARQVTNSGALGPRGLRAGKPSCGAKPVYVAEGRLSLSMPAFRRLLWRIPLRIHRHLC